MSHSNHFVPIFTPIFTSTLGLSVSARALYEALKPDISYTGWVSQSIRKSYFLKREYSEVRYLIARDRWVNDVFISIPMAHSMCLLQRGHRGISVRNELSITYGDISLKMKRDHRRSLRRTVIPIETISKRAHYWAIAKIELLISNGSKFDSSELQQRITRITEEIAQELDQSIKRRFPGDKHLLKNRGLTPSCANFVENWRPDFFELITGDNSV